MFLACVGSLERGLVDQRLCLCQEFDLRPEALIRGVNANRMITTAALLDD